MRVFQIGFNKCGTSSIWKRLQELGLRSCHLRTEDRRNVTLVMQSNLAEGRNILSGLEEYDGFTDLEYQSEDTFVEGYRLFREIKAQVPDSRFILNLRDRQKWIASRLDHNDGAYAAALMKVHGLQDKAQLTRKWEHDWDTHVAEVTDFFLGEDCLLVFDIEKDDISVIDAFLGLKLTRPAMRVPHNFTRSRFSIWISRVTPAALKDLMPKEFNRTVHYMLRKRR